MSRPDLHESGVDALVDYIERRSDARCSALLGDADTAARRLLSQVRAEANRGVRQAIRLDRQRLERQVHEEALRRRVKRKEQLQADVHRTLRALGPAVRKALEDLWQDPGARRAWIGNTLELAAQRLAGDRWTVRHPPDLDLAELAVEHDRADWIPDPRLSHGLLVSAGKASVDTTPAGLTAREEYVQGLLLGRIAAEAGGTADEQ